MSEAIWTISIGEELSGYILGTKIVDGFIFITSRQLIEVTKDLLGETLIHVGLALRFGQ